MSRQVNYHLARARAAASGAAGAPPCPVAACAGALVRTVLKLYAGRGLEISSWHRAGASRAGAKGGSRRDTRKPAGQRLQMGKVEDRVGRVPKRRHARADDLTTMDLGYRLINETWC